MGNKQVASCHPTFDIHTWEGGVVSYRHIEYKCARGTKQRRLELVYDRNDQKALVKMGGVVIHTGESYEEGVNVLNEEISIFEGDS